MIAKISGSSDLLFISILEIMDKVLTFRDI